MVHGAVLGLGTGLGRAVGGKVGTGVGVALPGPYALGTADGDVTPAEP